MGQLSGWQQGKGPEGLRTGRWWGAKWESRGGAHRGGGRRDLGGGRGQLPAEGPASTGPGQGRVRGRKEACVCSEARVRERRPERQAGATPAGRWSSDAERGSVVRGGPSVSVRVSVHEGRVWRDSRTWYSGCWARVDGSCHRYLPCHGKPPRSHPPLVSGLVFGSGLSGSASGTFASSQQSELCRALSPEVVRQRPADHLAGHAEGPVAASGGVAMERYDFHTCHLELRGPPIPPHTLGSPLCPPPAASAGAGALPAAAPPMPRVAQEGDEAWPDSGAPLRQRPQDPQPGWTCPWGPGLGREAGRAGGQGEGPWSHLRVTHSLSVPQFPQPGSASRRASSGLSEGWGAPCCTPGAGA